MPDGKKNTDNPAGDFASIRRRRPRGSGNRQQAADALKANADAVAGSSFLGSTGTATVATAPAIPTPSPETAPADQPAPARIADEASVGAGTAADVASTAPKVEPSDPAEAAVASPASTDAVPPSAEEDEPARASRKAAGPAPSATAAAPAGAEVVTDRHDTPSGVDSADAAVEASAVADAADHVSASGAEPSAEAAPRESDQATTAADAAGSRTSDGKKAGKGAQKRTLKAASESGRSRGTGEDPTYGENQRLVWDSFVDSRVHSRQWSQHGVNVIPEIWDLLQDRVKRDRKSSGEASLAKTHYIDAIVRSAPVDPDELEDLVLWINRELIGLPAGERTSMSMSPEARARFGEMLEALGESKLSRKGKDLISALALKMLRSLEDEGPMPKPKRVRLI
ncbi:hypothetical protein [Streptomyces fractus]|uniref:hypothetical protein n=1 Tax=Streptomyces fractus TaxID=641806 RepID=UPI003CF8A947